MKICVLQHAAFEGPGEIAKWAEQHGYAVRTYRLYRGDALPSLDSFDSLIVMGGEMNIYQYRDWPWLKPESAFVKATLNQGKRAVGICLGAQLIADALGARVVQNPEIELGWMPVQWTDAASKHFPALPAESTVLHWHGDTFGLPEGATRLAVSQACAEQGYVIPGQCLGLQFHLEVDPVIVEEYVAGQTPWPKGRLVQDPKAILDESALHCDANRQLLHGMLDRFFAE